MKKTDKEFIKKAYCSVPMYIRFVDKMKINMDKLGDLDSLPLITKEQVISHDSIVALHSMSLLYANKLIRARTSGSTGKYLDIYWKTEDYNKSMLPLWILRKKYYGIRPEDKMCFFYTFMELENEKNTYRINNQLGFSKSRLDMENLLEVYMQIQEFSPKWMMLQPSIGLLLCQCMDKYKLKPIGSIKYIEMSGEILTKETRAEVENHFKCKIADQYGANEFNSIAYECPEGNMHIMESNVIVEVLNNGLRTTSGTEGELHITTLTNSAMPLIRYRIGDIGKICTDKCSCGNGSKIIKITSGRANDYIQCKDGSRISSYVFVRAMDATNHILNGIIRQFQIVQKDMKEFEITLVIEEYEKNICDAIPVLFKKCIREKRLFDASYKFKYVTELLPNESNGKFTYFKRLVRQS